MKEYTAKEEQETVIEFEREPDEMIIWTSDTKMITKLDKIYPRYQVFKTNRHIWAVEYRVPKKLLTFRRGKNSISDSTKKARSAAMKTLNKGKRGR